MKRFFHCLFLLPSLLLAGPDSNKLGELLADVTGAQKMLEENFMASIDAAMAKMKGGNPGLLKAIKEATQAYYSEHYRWEELRPIFGRAYATEFTDDELKALIAFYESPVGKKAAEKLPTSSKVAAQVVADQMKDKAPQLQATLVDLVRKHLGAAGPKPGP